MSNNRKQTQERNAEEHFSSYWTPAPVGATHVQIRGDQWWGGDWAGKTTFAQLRPDTYTVCEGNQPDWNNTLPGTLHPAHNQPCYALIVRPRQVATITFGNRPAAIAANEATAATSTGAQPDAGGIIITDGIDVPFDDSGYAGHALPEVHEHQPALEQQIFLPFVQQ